MPFKEKTVFSKREYEYIDPDGDKWVFIVAEQDNRKFISFGQEGQEVINIDGEFLLEMADKYRELTSRGHAEVRPGKMKKPKVTDHRTMSEKIDDQVSESMNNISDEDRPVQSFDWSSDEDRSSLQSGVSVDAQGEVGETPDEIKQEVADVQEEINARRNKGKPNYYRKGSEGTGFKRVGASEII